MRIAANLAKARRSFGTRLIRSPRRRGRAPKPDRRSPSSRGTLPPCPRSRVGNTWWRSTGLNQTYGERAVGLSWQQGPLSTGAIGRFLVPEPLPKRLLYVEPLRRRMRARFGGNWIADSEHVLLLFEPGRYPVAYFPETDVSPHTLERTEQTTQHPDLGLTSWYSVRAGEQHIAPRGAWQHIGLPAHASELQARVAFAWRAMDAFYEEGERIVGHAADSYHRIDIRQASRDLVVRHGDRIIADTKRPLVLYESGFAPRWYVPRDRKSTRLNSSHVENSYAVF